MRVGKGIELSFVISALCVTTADLGLCQAVVRPNVPLARPSPITRPSGTASSGTPSSGTASGGTASGSVPAGMDAPRATAGSGVVSLQWTAPAGASVDSYQIDVVAAGTGTTSQLTVAAPATATPVAVSACAYPQVNCQTPMVYSFRMRAHNAAGYGPYSAYTSQLRPLVSYMADNLGQVWLAKGCASCHSSSASPPNFAASAASVMASLTGGGEINLSSPNNSKLLACPTATAPCGAMSSHPALFNASSAEYALVYRWIADGGRF